MRPATLPLAGLLFLALPSLAVAQTCPTNSWSAGGNGYFEEGSSTTPSGSLGAFSYDLVQGTFAGANQGFGEAGAFAAMALRDRYTIVGPASATPLTFHVRVRCVGVAGAELRFLPFLGLQCVGSRGTFSVASGSLSDEVEVTSYVPGTCAPQAFDETVELELVKLPGEEFLLGVGASLSAGHLSSISVAGTIRFDDLPAGYEIRSCYGYAGMPVPAGVRSWGSIKASYR